MLARLAFGFAFFVVTLSSNKHVDKKVSVKEVVFDSAVADIFWFAPENTVVIVRTEKGIIFC